MSPILDLLEITIRNGGRARRTMQNASYRPGTFDSVVNKTRPTKKRGSENIDRVSAENQ